MSRAKTADPPFALVLLLFFFSGALALVYQVVWSRMMTHVFGSTAVAVGTVLAAFMAGMAIGSWVIGRLSDRSANRLRLYAWLEIGIALAALISHLALDHMAALYPILHDLVGDLPVVLPLVRFASAFLIVMAPTVLMGATLPVLGRYLLSATSSVGARLGMLYSINTLGAVTGVLATGFVLIGRYGIHVPVFAAVAGNLFIGLIAWIAARRVVTFDSASGPTGQYVDKARGAATDALTLRVVLLGLGISGFTSFAYEIYWTRSLVFILGNSTYALTTMLSAFLTGIALGSYLVRFAIDRFNDRVVIFGWIQVSLGVISAMALPLLFLFDDPQSMNRTLVGISGQAFPLVLSGFGIAFLVMLMPAALIGATFPLVGHLAVRQLSTAGASVGKVYAINTLGNVLGALLPGLFLLSWLGIQKGILTMALLNVALGLAVLSLRLLRAPAHPLWRAVLPLVLVSSVVLMSQAPLRFQFPSHGERERHRTLFYREGPLATTKVFLDPANAEKHMSVDGITIGGTGNTQFKQLLLAHLPRLLIDDTSRELSVGLGSGILAGESVLHPGVAEITVVEIEPSVIQGAAQFREDNHGVLDDPRLVVVNDDIGNFLRTTTDRYRVISADEKTADEYASNGFSYSLDYYDLLREHLAEGGLVAQWVPTTLPGRQYRMILQTFANSFPHVQLWYFLPARRLGPFNSILIGSAGPISIDSAEIERRFAEHRGAIQSLAPYGLTSVESLLPHFVADGRTIREAVSSAPVNSLDHPRYEFYQPWEYAADKVQKVIENQAFILRLKRKAYVDFFARVSADAEDPGKLRQTFAAEFAYLEAFQKYLRGIPLADLYRQFDSVLAAAPWNDSLRARIYAQYRYFAATLSNPVKRQQLEQRADALYE
ncbi:MAG: fused MFS/spermidine synthase [Gammaproteobacteria bacterium]|nr:MAG: fused MFS/spermidine synthase [Gammaproteobacteria bacterium]